MPLSDNAYEKDLGPLFDQLARGDDTTADLSAALVHQGTVYPAAIEAVPLLAAQLRDDHAALAGIVALLAAIAAGRTYELPTTRKGKAYTAVKKLAPRIRNFIMHSRPEVRSAAAFFLAWFVDDKNVAPLQRAFGDETDPLATASLGLSLGVHGERVPPREGDTRTVAALTVACALTDKKVDLTDAARSAPWPELPFGDGSIADLAVGLLVKRGGVEGLLIAAAAGNEDAGLALVEKKPKDPQRVVEALLDGGLIRGDIERRLQRYALPTSVSAARKFIGRPAPRRATPLDRTVKFRDRDATIAAHVQDAVTRNDGTNVALAESIVALLSPADAVRAAIDVEELGGINPVNTAHNQRAWDLSVAVIAQAAPSAANALEEIEARVARDGPGLRDNPFGGEMECHTVRSLVALAHAYAALANQALINEKTAEHLPRFFSEPTSRALAALAPDVREAWLLDPRLDNRPQPGEHASGAWPLWVRWPSPRVTERVVELAAKWAPKDPWGGARSVYADPILRDYAAALRAQGDEAGAARCEALLDLAST